MEQQELKTVAVKGGKMLEGEPINYCGFTDYCMIAHFQKGLHFLLQQFVDNSIEQGQLWDNTTGTEVYCAFEVLEDVTDYQQAYLTRRIETLEAALGLKHNGDIDQPQQA